MLWQALVRQMSAKGEVISYHYLRRTLEDKINSIIDTNINLSPHTHSHQQYYVAELFTRIIYSGFGFRVLDVFGCSNTEIKNLNKRLSFELILITIIIRVDIG